MLLYRGVLDDRHLRAVMRVALRAHGFSMSNVAYEQAVAAQWQCGCWLRDQVLPEHLLPFVDPMEYHAIAELDPYLWNRLPFMAGLGFQQASVLHRLAPVSPQVDSTVAILGSVFNAGIALLDYLVDERHGGTQLFELLPPDIVRDMFTPDGDAGARLARACTEVPDPRQRLLLALVATCERGWRALYRCSGNNLAWAELANLIGHLYEAEQTVTLGVFRSADEMRQMLPAIEAKSVLSSVVMWQLSALAAVQPAELYWCGRYVSTLLGQILCRVDDLVDVLPDCRRGMPSLAVLRLAAQLTEQGRMWASDADLYDVVDACAMEVVELLRLDAFNGRNADTLKIISMPMDKNVAIAHIVPEVRLAHILEFAKLTVAGWVGWSDDDVDLPPSPGQGVPERWEFQSGTIGAAIDYLLVQQRDGYREAIHHLCFPRGTVMERRYETHPTLLFQRAVVLDSLLDAWEMGQPIPQQVLNAEALAILRAKHRNVRGGWSYIPQVPELPPDADDLGMVLQVLARMGGVTLASTCDEAIRLALDAAGSDGGFPTWVLDPRSQGLADGTMRAYLDVIGGCGVHPDVVANLLYGLIVYDPVRYQVPLRRAVTYLETAQDLRGFWSSKWYAGPYYGTYRVTAVLGFLAPGSASLKRARTFLLQTQDVYGGWGDAGSDPLSTALAVLALAAPGMQAPDPVIKRAASALIAAQNRDGAWAASPFISFPTTDGVETYVSRTITTAFCLKALLATRTMVSVPSGARWVR